MIYRILKDCIQSNVTSYSSCSFLGNGLIDFNEFTELMDRYNREELRRFRKHSHVTAPAQSREGMMDTFKLFDKDSDGYINAKDLKDAMQDLGINLSEDDVQSMMGLAGVGPKGKIYFQDFCRIMACSNAGQEIPQPHVQLSSEERKREP